MEVREFEEAINMEYENLNDDEHILKMWTPFKVNIDENYKFVSNNIIFKIASNLLYFVAYIVVFLINKIFFGFKVNGIKNLWGVEGGKITVSNHIHPMDCTMNALLNCPNKTYFTTIKSNFEIPVIRWIIKLLNAIPIPETISGKMAFYNAIDEILQNGKTVHFYPEASMRPYCNKIRKFKNGAFKFAVKNNTPIVPVVYTYAEPSGIRKIFKKKPFINANILPAIYPNTKIDEKTAVEELKNEVWKSMNNVLINKLKVEENEI